MIMQRFLKNSLFFVVKKILEMFLTQNLLHCLPRCDQKKVGGIKFSGFPQTFSHEFSMNISQFSMTIFLLKFCIHNILWKASESADFQNRCYISQS